MKKLLSFVVTMLVIIPLLLEEPEVEEPEVEEPEVEEPAELGSVLEIGQISMLSGAMALYGEQQVRGFALGLEWMSGGETDENGNFIIANRPIEVITKDQG